MPTKTEAIQRYLNICTHKGLFDLYNKNMEVQVNVAQDGGYRVDGEFKGRQWHAWSDGITTWKSFRIPYKANTDPEYTDTEITFDLAAHVEGIGMTGWDWFNKVSKWVAFDFDAISGHSEKHNKKLNENELNEVEKRVNDVPWITVRRSTSGKGLHLYVFVPEIKTVNHTEHAALARSILGMLSAHTRYDFQSKVDTCGGNMWVYHRKMQGTDGLKLIKQGSVLHDIPTNWRDHIPVVTGRRAKILPDFIVESCEDIFNELTGQNTRIPLDVDHHRLITFLKENNASSWWSTDHNMLVTHTWYLKKAHTELGLKGFFETLSPGTDLNECNCYLFPMRKGAWSVRRYTVGTAEHPTWNQDGQGWTQCFLNREPNLISGSKAAGGIEHPSGGYSFRHASMAQEAAAALGAQFNLPTWILGRKAHLKEHKDGRLIVEIDLDQQNDSGDQMIGWIPERGKWRRIFDVNTSDPTESNIGKYDDLLRHLVSEDSKDCGWVIKSDNQWRQEPLAHVNKFLKALGYNLKEIDIIIGASVFKPWTLVNRPFQPEIIGDRQWNRGAAQFRFTPTEDRDNLKFPTWNKILSHCGKGLDGAIQNNSWAKANGIITGGDYLKCWIASLFQEPLESLPYLFFFGDQIAGKSIFYESINLLVTRGVVNANAALEDPKYNGELANAILCFTEEIDLRKDKRAAERIKEWVTSREISIHAKNATPIMIPNSTHYVQCSNNHLSCPIFPGDTRITMIEVAKLEQDQIIPKKKIEILLEKEAPDFLAEILGLELPASSDPRLNIPVIVTEEKRLVESSNRTLLEAFIADRCHYVPGRKIKFSEFYDAYIASLDPSDSGSWSKIKVGRELPPKFCKGRLMADGAQFYIGNMSWTIPSNGEILKKLVVREETLIEEFQ